MAKTRQRMKGALGTLDHLYKAQTISNKDNCKKSHLQKSRVTFNSIEVLKHDKPFHSTHLRRLKL